MTLSTRSTFLAFFTLFKKRLIYRVTRNKVACNKRMSPVKHIYVIKGKGVRALRGYFGLPIR